MAVLISCETSGELLAEVPLTGQGPQQRGGDQVHHQAIDSIGFEMAKRVADSLEVPLVRNEYRHDMVDVTRSPRHPKLWGSLPSELSVEEKQRLIELVYAPYYDSIRGAVATVLREFTFAVHLSIRTFEPNRDGKRLRTDVGLLYDPTRTDEIDFCLDWIDQQYDINPNVRMRRNYPRRGTSNHLHKEMRRRFPSDQYLGIEVWLNRAWAARSVRLRDEAIDSLCESLRVTIGLPKTRSTLSGGLSSPQEVA